MFSDGLVASKHRNDRQWIRIRSLRVAGTVLSIYSVINLPRLSARFGSPGWRGYSFFSGV